MMMAVVANQTLVLIGVSGVIFRSLDSPELLFFFFFK